MSHEPTSPADRGREEPSHAWLPAGSAEEARLLYAVLTGAYQGMRDGSVAPGRSHGETAAEIEGICLDESIGLPAALREADALMEAGDLRSASARCFGYFNPTPAWPAVLADALAAARNPQLCVTSHAPASVEMERHVIRWLIEKLGLPSSSTGHFTSGGSEANETALLVALASSHPDYGEQGVSALGPRPVFYASEDSHLAWVKIARNTGLGTNALALVATDGDGRMDAAALEARIRSDLSQGATPVMIAATAGTTNAAALDPIRDCRQIADRHGIHLHVDAAWAGALAIDPKRRALLDGIELADSVTIDAHKWLNATMGAGMVFLRDPEPASKAFGVATGYMPVGDGADAYIGTRQWSRRLMGLRLWMILRAGGASLYQHAFDRQFAMADRLRVALEAAGWSVCNKTPLPVVLFEDARSGCDSTSIADVVNDTSEAWLGCVDYGGKRCLRACVTSFLTGPPETEALLAALERARDAVRAA